MREVMALRRLLKRAKVQTTKVEMTVTGLFVVIKDPRDRKRVPREYGGIPVEVMIE